MLSKQRCPYTGIVNYFTKADPFVSIGSITRQKGRKSLYHWRCYDAAHTIAGIAKDMSDAERRLERAYRRGEGGQRKPSSADPRPSDC